MDLGWEQDVSDAGPHLQVSQWQIYSFIHSLKSLFRTVRTQLFSLLLPVWTLWWWQLALRHPISSRGFRPKQSSPTPSNLSGEGGTTPLEGGMRAGESYSLVVLFVWFFWRLTCRERTSRANKTRLHSNQLDPTVLGGTFSRRRDDPILSNLTNTDCQWRLEVDEWGIHQWNCKKPFSAPHGVMNDSYLISSSLHSSKVCPAGFS